MPTDLPVTAIGLIAFIAGGAATLIWRVQKSSATANEKNIATFMTYIEKKNGNLERTAALFVEKSEEQQTRFGDMLREQAASNKETLDTFIAHFTKI